MRIRRNGTIQLWLSADDTYNWAHRPGASWPCSELSGHRMYAEFDRGDLIDLTVDGRSRDIPVDEFSAIIEDYLGSANPE